MKETEETNAETSGYARDRNGSTNCPAPRKLDDDDDDDDDDDQTLAST